ncbi:hypothetical protein XSR1_540019 [Xenorhabdus szentirmaii DSM 16338]|uniref:Uncharacterized protein n=1 Tax=Xenorhabdus szentirmaii DSM 16338 TaxID=1427518 RepID=W1J460_9GAMM|nr:hypothetical protein Xsze_01258 [Xenorhabdus szentirmaii DSM 16338]CDL84848.1 hypothetical protein XSR1_540019 [Xenorhabdus szentirmaii DSM 16338]
MLTFNNLSLTKSEKCLTKLYILCLMIFHIEIKDTLSTCIAENGRSECVRPLSVENLSGGLDTGKLHVLFYFGVAGT